MQNSIQSKQFSLRSWLYMSNRKEHSEKILKKIRILIMIGIAFYMFFLAYDNISIWDDELFTLRLIDGSWLDLWNGAVDDLVHPPLYYFLLKLVLSPMNLSHLQMITGAKMFSAFWVVVTMAYGSFLLKRRYEEQTALLFVLFLCGNMVIGYSVEIRMYSMAMCMTLLAFLYANELINESSAKNWIFFTIFTIIGIWTNYFAALALTLIWFYLLWKVNRRERRNWFICAGISVISYLPWILTVLTHSKSVTDYATAITFQRIMEFFAFPFSCHNTVVSVCLIVLTMILIVVILLNSPDGFVIISILTPVYVGIICILSAFIFNKFIVGRYLLPCWAVFWAGIAIGLYGNKISKAVLPILIVIDLCSLFFIATVETNDGNNAKTLLGFARTTTNKVYAGPILKEILEYWDDSLAIRTPGTCQTSGDYIVYFWSDEYHLLQGQKEVMVLPFSVNSVHIYRVE